MNKKVKEWTVKMPWGNVAMVAWGDPKNPPMLLVHGYMDTAATFILLLNQLPDTYYYVGFDFPGHGYSDPFPPGPLTTHAHWIEVIKRVVEHMKWDTFVYLSHSLGFLIGVLYNSVCPGKIHKMINIDPVPSLPWYYLSHRIFLYTQYFYNEIYGNYHRYTHSPPKLYTKREALRAVETARNLSAEQAEVVLSRSLVPVANGLFKLSWHARSKRITSTLIPEETLYTILTTNPPPMLNFSATERETSEWHPFEIYSVKMYNKIKSKNPHCYTVDIKGGHDLHITNPEDLVDEIVKFLNRDISSKALNKAKL